MPSIPMGKDNSAEIKKLEQEILDLNKLVNLKVNQSDFDGYKRDIKVNELDRMNRVIEELRQQGFTTQKNQEDLKKDFDQLSQFVDMLQKTLNSIRNQPAQ